MKCKFPVVLVHGAMVKEVNFFSAFGRIEDELTSAGHDVYVASIDGVGSIETNAEQLKKYVLGVLSICAAEKVNLIAYSKGGLDAIHMINNLGMKETIASLTTISTPYKGIFFVSRLCSLPRWIKRPAAFCVDRYFEYFLRDEHPDTMKVCEQLAFSEKREVEENFSKEIYCQSFSTSINKEGGGLFAAIIKWRYRLIGEIEHDGLIFERSAKFANYRGICLDIPVSHMQIADLCGKKSHKDKIYDFYKKICRELAEMGF